MGCWRLPCSIRSSCKPQGSNIETDLMAQEHIIAVRAEGITSQTGRHSKVHMSNMCIIILLYGEQAGIIAETSTLENNLNMLRAAASSRHSAGGRKVGANGGSSSGGKHGARAYRARIFNRGVVHASLPRLLFLYGIARALHAQNLGLTASHLKAAIIKLVNRRAKAAACRGAAEGAR